MTMDNLISLFGIIVLLGVAFVLSEDKKRMNARLILCGLGLQSLTAFFIFRVPAGAKLFLVLNDLVVKVLDSATVGARFVFGRLALPPEAVNEAGEGSLGFILAFQGFPTIIFFSSLVSVLYFCNIMPRVIRAFAYVFTKLMRVSGAESMVAAGNIFLGIESALTVKPHLKDMTRSEACAILTVGMATVASNVMALYVFSLRDVFPTIAAHLISASLLSAPAALVISKIMVPEAGQPATLGEHIQPFYEREKTLFEAVINGANAGVQMIVGIVALLIAVMGLTALADLFLGLAGSKLNALFGLGIDWSLKGLLGYLFYPFTLILGVPLEEAGAISRIIGERAILTEVVAYQDLHAAIASGAITHPRSIVVTAYALCGFAHVASMAIFVGGTSALAEEKRGVLAAVAPRALVAATLACLMTACVAGALFTDQAFLLGG
ncbi:MAG: nucleoside transporter [Candidatus Omnitrophica bacterium]|nr:nucleoside transporter [Candidatus Omnitrophota bacterium]